jgi:hydrogenase maturation factor
MQIGFAPFYIASQGKVVAFTKAEDSEKIFARMRETKYDRDTAIIR